LLRASEALRLGKDPAVLGQELAHVPTRSWVVVDEVQRVPALLDEVHRLIEERGLRFVLSGSSARKLKREGANLLAGRARVERMFPLTSRELGDAFRLDRALEHGTLPLGVTTDDPKGFLFAYAETYLQEEIRAEALTRNIGGFARFLEIAARQNAQVTNVSNIARDAQVARQTVQGYFEILADTLVGYWLPAWKLKRATKQIAHPKFYFFDTGVVRALSGRVAYPLLPEERGAQLETLILGELRAYLAYERKGYPLYFWSSHDGVEVDVILEDARGLLAFEIKAASRWGGRDHAGLGRLRRELGLSNRRLFGVFRGARRLTVDGIAILPVEEVLARLWDGDLVI
jgi:predicted AAA+ superfamily ATPase